MKRLEHLPCPSPVPSAQSPAVSIAEKALALRRQMCKWQGWWSVPLYPGHGRFTHFMHYDSPRCSENIQLKCIERINPVFKSLRNYDPWTRLGSVFSACRPIAGVFTRAIPRSSEDTPKHFTHSLSKQISLHPDKLSLQSFNVPVLVSS